MRQLQEINHPEDANASGGMYAFARAVADFFHACLLMIPAVFLVRLLSRYETVYTAYSKFLFCLSVTAPVLLAVSLVGPLEKIFGELCLMRLMAAPFVFRALSRNLTGPPVLLGFFEGRFPVTAIAPARQSAGANAGRGVE